jgi:ribosome-associated protein
MTDKTNTSSEAQASLTDEPQREFLDESSVDPAALEMARTAAKALWDLKGVDISGLYVGDLLGITEFFVIASGNSRRHVRSLAEEAFDQLRESVGRPTRSEGGEEGEWVLLDYGSVVIHVFHADARKFYDLDRLWGDAPRLTLAFENE